MSGAVGRSRSRSHSSARFRPGKSPSTRTSSKGFSRTASTPASVVPTRSQRQPSGSSEGLATRSSSSSALMRRTRRTVLGGRRRPVLPPPRLPRPPLRCGSASAPTVRLRAAKRFRAFITTSGIPGRCAGSRSSICATSSSSSAGTSARRSRTRRGGLSCSARNADASVALGGYGSSPVRSQTASHPGRRYPIAG